MASGNRSRVREVLPRLRLGYFKPGHHNAITDVPGVLVSTQSIHRPKGHNPTRPESVINTGVTVILPRKEWFTEACYAAIFSFNGAGEMTGSHWINETGLLNSPIVITNTFSVGSVYDGVYRYAVQEYTDKKTGLADWFISPVIAETYDGGMNDIAAMAVTPEMVVQGIEQAKDGPVAEGNTGGGTGMLTMGFKAGTGTSSRSVAGLKDGHEVQYTVGCLVQSNFGAARDLRFGQIPVGREWAERGYPSGFVDGDGGSSDTAAARPKDGSIIIVLATDAPLHPTQLGRLVKRATVGLARTGGFGSNSSGDIFIAFSTANTISRATDVAKQDDYSEIQRKAVVQHSIDVIDDTTIDALFEAAAEAVQESILNALCKAETMTGPLGFTAKCIDYELLKKIAADFNDGQG